ncbi:unnamed protein product [Ectocarpus fasciculatus]
MSVEEGGWEGGGLPKNIDRRVESVAKLLDGCNDGDNEGKNAGEQDLLRTVLPPLPEGWEEKRIQGRTVDVVGAAAPAPATTRPQLNLVQEQPEEDLHSVGRILVGSIPGGVSSIGSDTTYDEFCKRCGSTSSFGVNSERLLKLAVHEALELQTPQSQPFSTSGQIQGDQTNTTTAVRQMLSTERDLSIHVRKLVEFVQNKDEPALQFDSARLLGNISASHTHVVVKNGAVPIFVRLLTSANDDIREEAVSVVAVVVKLLLLLCVLN